MASAARGSGAGGGDRCPSGEKGTTRVGRRSKKPSAFHRAVLFIGQCSVIWKNNIENAWQGTRNLRLILRIYCGVTVRHHQNSEVSAPPSSSAPARNPLEHSVFQRKDS